MPVATFELDDLKREGYSAELLKNIVPMIGIEIENMSENEMQIYAAPNRPDLLDFTGFVRTLDYFTGKRVPKENFYKTEKDPILKVHLDKKAKELGLYVGGLVVKNVNLNGNNLRYLINFTEKLAETYGRKRKKIALGLHNFDVIKGEVTFTASKSESFVPLNEKRKLSFEEIMQKHEKGLQYKFAIPNYGKRKVAYPFLKDQEKIIAMIPIINSEATKVTEKTTNIFVDITGTSIAAIRDVADLIGSSFIYKGCHVYPIQIIGQKGSALLPTLEYNRIKVNMREVNRVLGTAIEKRKTITLANNMGYVAAQYGNSTIFYVPPYRIDVLNEQDITEDIAIAFGYDKINPLPVVGVADGLAGDLSERQNDISVFMVGLGYMEAINSSLTNERTNYENMNYSYKSDDYVNLSESKTANISMLRTMMLPGLLENLNGSKSEKMPQRLFEIGSTFKVSKGKAIESLELGFVSEHAKANFSEVRSAADALLKYLEVSDYKILEHNDNAFIEGRCARIELNKKIAGVFGELHPKILQKFGLEEPTIGFELTLIEEVEYEF